MARITDQLVRNLTAPAAGNAITWDDQIPGFGVRITAGGVRAFVVNYVAGGVQRRLTIGKYPAWTVQAAREEAKEIRRRIDRGDDPMEERHAYRAAPSIDDLADEVCRDHFSRLRDFKDIETLLRIYIRPDLGKRKVVDVGSGDIDKWFREATKRSPSRANKALAYLSVMFGYAAKHGYRPDNPCRGIKKNIEEKRERFLSPAEIARLVEALAADRHQQAANAILFMLLTGCRRGEALHATWKQIDLSDRVWTKPSSHTKQKRQHRVPFNEPALQLVKKVDQLGPFVFGGGKPLDVTPVRRTWLRVSKAAGLSGVRIHDLRHTYASLLVSSGLSLPIIGALLGHSQPATTARYAHLADDPLREATERVGSIVSQEKTAEIIPLKRTEQS